MKQQIDHKIMNCFMAAVKEVFQLMGQCKKVDYKGMKVQHQYFEVDGYSAVIYFYRPNGGGVVSLCFPNDTAANFVTKMTGKPAEQLESSDYGDVVGEFANMISGSAGSKLGQQGYGLTDISPPLCFSGTLINTSAEVPTENLYMVLTFELDGEKFYLQLCADERYKLSTQN